MAVTLGILGAFAVGLAGNLEIVWEVLFQNEVGSAEFWTETLDIKDLNTEPVAASTPRYETANWWWWRSSRVINEHTLANTTENVFV